MKSFEHHRWIAKQAQRLVHQSCICVRMNTSIMIMRYPQILDHLGILPFGPQLLRIPIKVGKCW